jgi:hypothetical protein
MHNKKVPQFVHFARYNQNAEVEEDEMSRACSMHGKRRDAYRVLV